MVTLTKVTPGTTYCDRTQTHTPITTHGNGRPVMMDESSNEIVSAMHSGYPHFPGYLIGCDACEFGGCHCSKAVANGFETECVWIGHVDTDQWRAATEEETIDYLAGYITANENVRETENGIEFREG